MSESPLVSILINNYNYGRFLGKAIDSALNQTYDNVEVIVVDDESVDESHQVMAQYGDRILPILKPNGGQASTFNAGFAASNGELICFLDADDVFLPDKVKAIVDKFSQFPDAGWCFHMLKLVNAEFKPLTKEDYVDLSGEFEDLTRINSESFSIECDLRNAMAEGTLKYQFPFRIATSSMCFRRSLLQEILPMPDEIRITSDRYLQIMAMSLSKGITLGEELSFQRIHGNNAYTLKKNKYLTSSKVSILTAYWTKKRLPSIAAFTNSLFSMGLGLYWCVGRDDQDIQLFSEQYFKSVSPFQNIIIRLKAIYYYFKYK